jgi:Protein of unknown function (DUF2568)
MLIVKSINLGLRFLLEVCALTALGYWGFKAGQGIFLKIVLGIGTPLLAAVIWGMFGSPKAPYKVSAPVELLLEVLIYGGAAFALYATGKNSLAVTFIFVVVINKFLMIVWGQ